MLMLVTPATLAHARQGEPLPRLLKVATLELPAQDEEQWLQRRDQVVQLLEALQPDVIAVQRVQQDRNRNNPACWLAVRLRYSCDFATADPPSVPLRQGSAMLSRLAVAEDGVTLLHPPGRFSAAGMLRVTLGDALVNVYVASLRPEPDEAAVRRHQTSDLLTWIGATSDGLPSVIAGDFSASTAELVSSAPGFQPARRNPGEKADAPATPATPRGHGLDVLFQVKHFSGVSVDVVKLEGLEDRLGILATLQLEDR